jgi:hypothetical protein
VHVVTLLADGQESPSGLTVYAATAYWGNETILGIVSCGIGGCSDQPTVVYAGVSGEPNEIVVDASNIYWTDGVGRATSCLKSRCNGGTTPLAWTGRAGNGLAINAGNAYWVDTDIPATIVTCPLPGCPGAPTTLATSPDPWDLLVEGDQVVWDDFQMGGVWACPTTGCASPTQVVASSPVSTIATFGGALYWGDQYGTVSQCAPIGSACVPSTLASGVGEITSIAVDAAGVVYWGTKGSGTGKSGAVMKLPPGAANPTTLVPNLVWPNRVVVDNTNVYWSDVQTNTVATTTK